PRGRDESRQARGDPEGARARQRHGRVGARVRGARRGGEWSMRQLVQSLLLALALLSLAPASPAAPEAPARPLVVASKKFPESVLLAEILAQALEHEGVSVERRVNLGNTALAFEALKQGTIDVYPEYSGTALGLIGLDRSRVKRGDVTLLVRRELERRFGLSWGPPLGFDN